MVTGFEVPNTAYNRAIMQRVVDYQPEPSPDYKATNRHIFNGPEGAQVEMYHWKGDPAVFHVRDINPHNIDDAALLSFFAAMNFKGAYLSVYDSNNKNRGIPTNYKIPVEQLTLERLGLLEKVSSPIPPQPPVWGLFQNGEIFGYESEFLQHSENNTITLVNTSITLHFQPWFFRWKPYRKERWVNGKLVTTFNRYLGFFNFSRVKTVIIAYNPLNLAE